MARKLPDLKKGVSGQSTPTRRPDKRRSRLREAILETAQDMLEAGVVDEETYSWIVGHKEK